MRGLLLLAAIPPVRLVLDLFACGENIPSNDDMIFLQIMDRITAPGYDWMHFFKDTFVQGHSVWLGELLFMPYAAAGLDQHTGIAIGIGLMLIRFYLIQDMLLPRLAEPARTLKQTMALILMSAVFFAPNNVSILSHGTFAIIWQTSLLGTTLMLWALSKHAARWSAPVAALGLVINAGTVGDALPMIPIAAAWYWWHRQENGPEQSKIRAKNLAIFITTAVIACIPYLAYLHTGAANSDALSKTYFGLDIMRFASTLARNFATGSGWHYFVMDTAAAMSAFGIILFGTLVANLFTNQDQKNEANKNSLLIATYSISTIAAISTYRFFIFPWYGLIAMYFWLALLALAARCQNKYMTATTYLTVFSFVLFAPHFVDKEFFLANRTPVFASVLREPETMPDLKVYTGPKIIGMDMQHFSEILKRHSLHPFTPHEKMLMQGDTGLQDRVKLTGATIWVDKSKSSKQTSPASAQRLSLQMARGDQATWQAIVPASYPTAVFHAKLHAPDGTRGMFSIRVRTADSASIISKNIIINQTEHDITLPLPLDAKAANKLDITLQSAASRTISLSQPLISLD